MKAERRRTRNLDQAVERSYKKWTTGPEKQGVATSETEVWEPEPSRVKPGKYNRQISVGHCAGSGLPRRCEVSEEYLDAPVR